MSKDSFKVSKSITLKPQSSSPTSPENGDMYYDSNLGLRKYEGGNWKQVTPTADINYIGNPDAESSTTGWVGYNSTDTGTFSSNAGTLAFTTTASAHTYFVGMPVIFTTTGTLPTGINAGTTYYVSVLNSANQFFFSSTLGGSSIAFTNTGSGTMTIRPLVPVVDGNVGTSLTGLTFSRSTSSPLRGSGSFSLVQTNSTVVAGQGVSYAFTIDAADQAKSLSIILDYNASSTFVASSGQTGSDSDIEIYIVDVTNGGLIPVSPKVITANGSNNFTFKGTFQTSSNSTSYKLVIYSSTANANATGWTFKWDNVFVGTKPVLTGPAITDCVQYTPTITGFGTPSNVNVFSRRVGSNLEVQGYFASGTSTAVQAQMTLGFNGVNGNVTINSSNVGYTVGDFSLGTASTTLFSGAVLSTSGSVNYVTFGAQNSTTTANNSANGNTLAVNAGAVSFKFSVPIYGWSSNVQMSNDTDTREVSASYTTANTTVTNGNSNVTKIPFTAVIKDTHAAYNTSTGVYTVPVSGRYRIDVNTYIVPASGAWAVAIFKNGTISSYSQIIGTAGGQASSFALLDCVAGDTIDIRGNQNSGSGNSTFGLSSTSRDQLTIQRLSGPATIAATESVNARYYASSTSISGSLATVVWTTKDYDSHNGMSSGVYTVPVSGKYQVNANIYGAGTFALNQQTQLVIAKNGTSVSNNIQTAGGAESNMTNQVSDIINCAAGDLITIKYSSGATSPSIVSSNTANWISISRVGN